MKNLLVLLLVVEPVRDEIGVLKFDVGILT